MSDRKKYIDEVAQKMKKWDDEIVSLESKSKSASAEMKAEYRKKIEYLRKKKEELKVKLDKLKNSSDDVWEELSKGIENSMEEMKKSFDEAKAKLN